MLNSIRGKEVSPHSSWIPVASEKCYRWSRESKQLKAACKDVYAQVSLSVKGWDWSEEIIRDNQWLKFENGDPFYNGNGYEVSWPEVFNVLNSNKNH